MKCTLEKRCRNLQPTAACAFLGLVLSAVGFSVIGRTSVMEAKHTFPKEIREKRKIKSQSIQQILLGHTPKAHRHAWPGTTPNTLPPPPPASPPSSFSHSGNVIPPGRVSFPRLLSARPACFLGSGPERERPPQASSESKIVSASHTWYFQELQWVCRTL